MTLVRLGGASGDVVVGAGLVDAVVGALVKVVVVGAWPLVVDGGVYVEPSTDVVTVVTVERVVVTTCRVVVTAVVVGSCDVSLSPQATVSTDTTGANTPNTNALRGEQLRGLMPNIYRPSSCRRRPFRDRGQRCGE